MYDDFKTANYSKALLSPELYARHLSRLYTGDVIDGFTVAPGTGLQVVLSPGNALVRYGSANVASARLVSLVNTFNLAIGTPDASNPRIDLVVLYVDNAVSLPAGTPTSANLDGKGVAKAKIVPGTPAATPSAPNSTGIQASVGAGNPYTVLYQVRVEPGVALIASNKITDIRALSASDAQRISPASITAAPDANGWTYNYPMKAWIKRSAYTTGSISAGAFSTPYTTALPVGMATLNNRPVLMTPAGNGINDAQVGIEFTPTANNPTTATGFRLNFKNTSGGAATYAGQVTFVIYDA